MAPLKADISGVLKGLQMVTEASLHEHRKLCKHLWINSSVRDIMKKNSNRLREFAQVSNSSIKELNELQTIAKECGERTCVITTGLREIFAIKLPFILKKNQTSDTMTTNKSALVTKITDNKLTLDSSVDTTNLDISSITLKELEHILSNRHKDMEINLRTDFTKSKQIGELNLSKSFQKEENITASKAVPIRIKEDVKDVKEALPTSEVEVPTLKEVAKQRPVPATRLGRIASFGSLFAGLGFGTINELTKGVLGLGGSKNVKDALLSPANVERIVDTLCKVRGAALKIGQILSIQDSNVVSPQLAKAFERVRQAADYMPDWQVKRVLTQHLGKNWRDLLKEFDEKPFAAASIGQVHRAVLYNGMPVAMKIQYPGVAQSIESDIDNLVGILKLWDIFPHGFFIDNVVKVAKRELIWEVDYLREAEYTENFKKMISPYAEYYVPIVVKELTTANVLTTELVPGLPLDKCFNLSYDERCHIGKSVLKLCLRELFELQCMQTDPNWSNFLYDINSRKLMLIDFGSTRFYKKDFINNYKKIVINAVNNNRKGVLDISKSMGFLTGYETKQMEEAHVDAVMILGEIFRYKDEYDFGHQNITNRIAHLVPTMVAYRLCPPPEEIYSIHRKLSGIFLLCARLRVKLNCRSLYEDIVLK